MCSTYGGRTGDKVRYGAYKRDCKGYIDVQIAKEGTAAGCCYYRFSKACNYRGQLVQKELRI